LLTLRITLSKLFTNLLTKAVEPGRDLDVFGESVGLGLTSPSYIAHQ